MDQPTDTTITPTDAAPTTIAKPRASLLHQLRVAPCLLAVLCFLLPFTKLSCTADPNTHRSLTGVKFVFGGEVVTDAQQGRTEKLNPEPWAIVAFGLAGVALLLALTESHLASGLFSAAGIVALFVFHQTFAEKVRIQSRGAVVSEMDVGMILAMIMLLVGAALAFHLAKKPPSVSAVNPTP